VSVVVHCPGRGKLSTGARILKGRIGLGGGERRLRTGGFDDEDTQEQQRELKRRFTALEACCHLDFEANLEKLYHGETLHKTAEYL